MPAWKSNLGGWLLWLAGTLAGLPAVADGQDFRVDTEVFDGRQKEPIVETLTIFTGGMVYDFLLTEHEVTVFDPLRGRFTLLDEARQVKASIATQELMEFSLGLETHAAESKDTLLAFAARPQFETAQEDVNQNGQALVRIKLTGKPLEYVVLGQQPQRPEAVQVYRHFADWYARLNATRPLNLPAGARLAVNQAIAERNLLPLEITRTITPSSRLNKKEELKSRHLVNWALSGKDRHEIERVSDMLATFKVVSYDEYRRAPAHAAQSKQANQAKR